MLSLLAFLMIVSSLRANETQLLRPDFMPVKRRPTEAAVLALPNKGCENWKESVRHLTDGGSLVQFLPSGQTLENWSEVITIDYTDWSLVPKNMPRSVEGILSRDQAEEETASNGSSNERTILEKDENSFLYEINPPSREQFSEWQIGRVCTTKGGFHNVSITRKKAPTTQLEKEEWIKILKNNFTVLPWAQAAKMEGLSLPALFRSKLELGAAFDSWKRRHTYLFSTGFTETCYVPPEQSGDFGTECLEIQTRVGLNVAPIEKVFDTEKKIFEERAEDSPVKFQVLRKSPTEITYSFTHWIPHLKLQLTGVVRTISSENGNYSFVYKRALPEEMKQEEVKHWKNQLEKIIILEKI